MDSIWMRDYVDKKLPSINKDMEVPIIIIGGGIAGLMCAYNLMKNNIKFILVDSKKLAHGVSASTTAQVTIAHDDIYKKIEQIHGEDKAITYLNYQIEGLKLIKDIIKNEKINCDYKEESTILYANDKQNIKTINEEYKMIKIYNKDLKLLYLQKNDINFVQGMEFCKQFIFNPMKYMMSIIDILIKNKIELFENSTVTKIKKNGKGFNVLINDKYKINAQKVIMACHYPFLNPDNLYFAKIYQSKSYAIAFKTELKLNANYVSLDKPYYYLRTYDSSTLIIGGSDHYTGINIDIELCYEKLIDKIYELDKNATILCKWFTEDCMTLDSLPFLGKYSNRNSNIFLITGFNKWGFTNSHIASKELINILLNKKEDNLYDTSRSILIKNLKSTIRMIAHSINGLVISKLFIKNYELNKIEIGSGKVSKYKGYNLLIYRENKDEFIFLENKCTHMGCSLIWNDIDKVWESKCHGSIFDKYGHVIYGPAFKDLKRVYFN